MCVFFSVSFFSFIWNYAPPFMSEPFLHWPIGFCGSFFDPMLLQIGKKWGSCKKSPNFSENLGDMVNGMV